jgi:hypothetical protein
MADENHDRLRKMRTIFDELFDAYAKCYHRTERLAVDEIAVLSFLNSTYQRNANGLE